MDVPTDITGVALETERLLLRPWRESDLDDFYAYASVDGVGEAAGWRHHESRDESRRILDIFITGKNVFALEYKPTGRVIGSLGLHPSWANDETDYAALRQKELGYVLSREYWGRGLATEAVRSVLGYCFFVLALDAVTVGHFTHNDRSRRVIEKCGFAFVKNGEYYAKQLDKSFGEMKYILTRESYLRTRA